MMMKNYNLWSRLTFKTKSYRKNFDLTLLNENFITEHEGTIGEVRYDNDKPPFIVGEYGFSVWNWGFANQFNVDLLDIIKEYKNENSYEELIHLIRKKKYSIDGINKLVLIHSLIIHPDYRKKGIVEEFFEFIYRDFGFGSCNDIIALVKPIQKNEIDWDFYFNKKIMKIKELPGKDAPYERIPAAKYFGLNQFENDDDPEITEYKLFSVVSRCGFSRLNESHLFKLKPNKIMERLKIKRKEYNKTLI